MPSDAGLRCAHRTGLLATAISIGPPPLPEVGEIDLIRHYTNLSHRNMSIDTNFYPLGSCTMKYNPKRHERLAALSGLAGLHPLQDDATCQGMLEILYEMQTDSWRRSPVCPPSRCSPPPGHRAN